MQDDSENIELKKENISSPSEEAVVNKKTMPKKGCLYKLSKFLLYFSLGFIALILGIIIIIQTSFFKNWLLQYALEKVNESLVDKQSIVSAESIEGSILGGFKLNNASLIVKTDTLVKLDYIDIDFDLSQLGNKLILVNSLIIESPQLNLTKVRDENDSLIWNFEYLMKPEKPEVIDTVEKKFDWGIIVGNLEIRNGNFRLLADKDTAQSIREVKMDSISQFDIENFDITDFNLELSGDYFPDEKSVSVQNLSFNTNSPIIIKEFAFDGQLSEENFSEIKNLKVITDRSNINIKVASLENFNPFEGIDYEEFGNKKANLDLVLDRFNTDDLSFFLPVLNFMKGNIYLDIKAKGKYESLPIEKLVLKTNNSTINISGKIFNLHNPPELSMDVALSNSIFDPNDTKANLPGIPIPDFSQVGIVYADITFDGEPLRFNSDFDIRSGVGNVNGKTFFDLTQNSIVYKSDVSTRNLNIGKIIKNNELNSNLNVDLITDGRGFDYRTLTAKVNYDISGSSIFDQNISKSTGKLDLNSGNIDLIVQYSSNTLTTNVKGKVDFRNIDRIKYNLEGNSRNLDLSTITKETSDKSNLNFVFNVNGEGLDPDKITGKFLFDIAPSTYNTHLIPQTPVNASIENTAAGKSLTLTSNFIDVNADGKFSFITLSRVLAANINEITEEIKESFKADSINYSKPSNDAYEISSDVTQSISSTEDLNVRYKLKIKNILPLAVFTGDSSLVFKADITGNIVNDENNFTFNAAGSLRDFKFQDSTIMFSKAFLNLNMNTDYSSEFNRINTNLDFKSYNFIAGGTKLDTVTINLNVKDNKNKFRLASNRDTNLIIYTYGSLGLGESRTEIILDTLGFTYMNYNFGNDEPIKLNYEILDTIKNINFESFKVSDKRQTVKIKGKYSLNGESDFNVSARKIKTSDLQLLADPYINVQDLIKGNIRRFELKYTGSLDKPVVHIEANSDILRLANMNLGRLDAFLDYKDDILKPDISFYNPSNKGKLLIYGDVPIHNPLMKSGEIDTSIKILEKDVKLIVDANNFQIRLLEQMIPQITALDGTMNGKVNVNGNVINPLLTGQMKLDDGAFTIDLTGMRYNFYADLITDKQKLILKNSKINTPEDKTKFLSMAGYIDFTNLKLSDLDFLVTGDIKILDDAVRKNDLGIYGNLYAGSGIPYLRIKGNSQRIDLTGNLVLIKGNVFISPEKQSGYDSYQDFFVYKVQIDSSSFPPDRLSAFLTNLRDSIKSKSQNNYNPFDKLLVKDKDDTVTITQKKPSKFFYNINVSTQRNIFIDLVIDPKTNQEFFGEVNTNLFINNSKDDSMQVRGKVNIGENSYYKFYRNFKAGGYLEFLGNMFNPELFIDAVYETKTTNPDYPAAIRDVRVELDVRGEAAEPKLIWKVFVNGSPRGGDEPSGDALSFLLFGRFSDELNASQRLNLASSVGANIGTAYFSGYLSDVLRDYLPFIINAEINYKEGQSGTFASKTDVRFTAEVGDATVRFGGQILTDITNTNIVVDYPLNKLLNIQSLSSNLIFQFERLIDPLTQSTTQINFENRTGALLIYKIQF